MRVVPMGYALRNRVLEENQVAMGFWRKRLPKNATNLVIEGPSDQLWYFRFST